MIESSRSFSAAADKALAELVVEEGKRQGPGKARSSSLSLSQG